MKITITKTTAVNRSADAPLYEGEAASLKDAVAYCAANGIDLRGADLRGADLRDLDLRGVDFGGVDLTGADLSGTQLDGAYLGGAALYDLRHDGATLEGVDVTAARGVTDAIRAAVAVPVVEAKTDAAPVDAVEGVGGSDVAR